MRTILTAAIAGTVLMLGASKTHALTTTLYNGTGSPTTQSWVRPVPAGVEALGSPGITLDTTSGDSVRDGYTRLGQTLNRTTGYNLRFDLRVISENHDNLAAQNNTGTDAIADRAGVSIIVLSSDNQGIELGFWTDRIWAQEDGAVKADPVSAPTGTRFTQAEGIAFNTQTAITQYDLSILGNTYYLYINGDYSAPVLTNRLRDYSPEPAPAPYTTPNFIYIGDNTTSARGSFQMNQVLLSDSAIAPVPFGFNPLLGLGLFALNRVRQTMQNKQAKS